MGEPISTLLGALLYGALLALLCSGIGLAVKKVRQWDRQSEGLVAATREPATPPLPAWITDGKITADRIKSDSIGLEAIPAKHLHDHAFTPPSFTQGWADDESARFNRWVERTKREGQELAQSEGFRNMTIVPEVGIAKHLEQYRDPEFTTYHTLQGYSFHAVRPGVSLTHTHAGAGRYKFTYTEGSIND